MFIGEDFFQLLVTETNRYYKQTCININVKNTKQWQNTAITEIKKFLALDILMGQVKKNNVNYYWTTGLYVNTNLW